MKVVSILANIFNLASVFLVFFHFFCQNVNLMIQIRILGSLHRLFAT
ncbi:hypothetical protein ENHAE0001_1195 [Enhydrobacter aerosaccus SK60]|nr:hypothetical protein ENHAE0001_1195 [Enhydrobacter aerosaccus SK60]